MGPRADLDDMNGEKFVSYWDSNSEPSVIHTITSHHTDYAIPAYGRRKTKYKIEQNF
jgi:hypothetical protein